MSTRRTKYSVSQRTRWHRAQGVRMSDHALERWDERTPDWACAPEVAWERGEDILHTELVDCRMPYDHDRARVYNAVDYCVVFPVRTHTITTVLDAARFDHAPTRSYLHSYGPHGGSHHE